MSITSLAVAKAHLRVPFNDDDNLIQAYLDSAEEIASRFLYRQICTNESSVEQAKLQGPVDLANAIAARDAALASAKGSSDQDSADAITQAMDAFYEARGEAYRAMNAMIITPTITAGVLLILGHLYLNREDVITGVRAAAVQLPQGAMSLMEPFRKGLGV